MTVVPFQPPADHQTPFHGLDPVELAEIVANTDFVPKGLRGNQPAILACILYGREVGLQPMQSLESIAVIDGKPSLSAEVQRALIYREGHELWTEESTNTRAIVAGRRRGSKITQRVTWTLDDAKRARIAGKQNWQAYPRAMLVARASAELARQMFPDVIGGLAAREELEDVVETPPTDAQGEPQQPTTRRRRRTQPPPAPPLPPSPGPPPVIKPPEEPPPDPEPAEPDDPTDDAIKKMFALFREKGMGDPGDRDVRLAYTQRVIDRQIKSSSELTGLDVSRVIDALQQEPDPQSPFQPPIGAVETTSEQRSDILPDNEATIMRQLEDELAARPPLPDDAL